MSTPFHDVPKGAFSDQGGLAKRIREMDAISVHGRRVFVRVDFNVPLKNGAVSDDTRIRAHIPTLKRLHERGAKLILASHLGRPKGQVLPEASLAPIAERLSELLRENIHPSFEVIFAEDCLHESNGRVATALKPNQLLLLENLRFHIGETKNDPEFAKQLRSMADAYVNDAFGTCHRAHASTHAMAYLLSEDARAAGDLLLREIRALAPVLENPERPLAAVLGGAKVSDKIKVIESFIQRAQVVLIGGAMAHTFLRAQGIKTGASLVEEEQIPLAKRLLDTAEARGVRVVLPLDHLATDAIKAPTKVVTTKTSAIPDGLMGADIGPVTRETFRDALKNVRTVVWNGPMGVFEQKEFSQGTLELARFLGELSRDRGVCTITGGGDSIAAVNAAGIASLFTHISTGGGATLEFLEGKLLPGLEPLLMTP